MERPLRPPCCNGVALLANPSSNLGLQALEKALAVVGSNMMALYPCMRVGLCFPLCKGTSQPPVNSTTAWPRMADFNIRAKSAMILFGMCILSSSDPMPSAPGALLAFSPLMACSRSYSVGKLTRNAMSLSPLCGWDLCKSFVILTGSACSMSLNCCCQAFAIWSLETCQHPCWSLSPGWALLNLPSCFWIIRLGWKMPKSFALEASEALLTLLAHCTLIHSCQSWALDFRNKTWIFCLCS